MTITEPVLGYWIEDQRYIFKPIFPRVGDKVGSGVKYNDRSGTIGFGKEGIMIPDGMGGVLCNGAGVGLRFRERLSISCFWVGRREKGREEVRCRRESDVWILCMIVLSEKCEERLRGGSR
jgi:hypothetical protein